MPGMDTNENAENETPYTQTQVSGFGEMFRRRIPSVERRINDIKSGDMRVRIIGTVIDKADDRIVIDDGSGKINIGFDAPVDLEINQIVRVFGRVIPIENGFELQGEIAQDMSKLDISLYEKIQRIKSSIAQ